MTENTVAIASFATRLRLIGVLTIVLVSMANAKCGEIANPLPLHNGTNVVNLDGAGLTATVVIARRDNFNAHSFEVTTFFASLKTEDEGEKELKIIPIELTREKEVLHLITGGGADCVLQDFRVIPQPAERTAILITGEREFGRHFADSQHVTFRYYRLTRNTEGAVGRPALYFDFEKKAVSQKKYCDVNEAFEAELHLPANGRGSE